jgi:4-alpha-glucanotransferase
MVLGGRRAGVVAHPTSLPGAGAAGTIGTQARRFADWCARAGLGVWQVLPLGPTHGDRSPYQCQSVLAGDPQLIDRDLALASGWPQDATLGVSIWLAQAMAAFDANAEAADVAAFESFAASSRAWLPDFCLFRALRDEFDQRPWWQWPAALCDRESAALLAAEKRLSVQIRAEAFGQFLFDRQWHELRDHARNAGVVLFGDAPIFVAQDSADVWMEPHLFQLGPDRQPIAVAGVPPDYFSATGQRWGNPLYDWDRMAADGFDWWIRRLSADLDRVDILRLDHFRGLEAYWAILADEETAVVGHWADGPGAPFLEAIRTKFGSVPIVAEDLGIITDEVTDLRDGFGLPGMKVLQFAFGGDATNPYLPHNHERNCVVYTGTHDNDTTVGWAHGAGASELASAARYLNCDEAQVPQAMLNACYASVADLAVVPMQDLLGLDSSHRMNTPGVAEGNWAWKFEWDDIPDALAGRLRDMASRYGRLGPTS